MTSPTTPLSTTACRACCESVIAGVPSTAIGLVGGSTTGIGLVTGSVVVQLLGP